MMSAKAEVEQDVISSSIKDDADKRITNGLIPLMFNRLHKLDHNKHKALHVYNQQVKKFNQKPQDKEVVIQSEAKLQSLGHAEFVRNLTPEQNEMLPKNSIQKPIPWRVNCNENSLSTPCRFAFDVSQQTVPNTSLSEISAKGRNNMNKLIEP